MSSHRLLRDWMHCDTQRSEEVGDREKDILHWKSNTVGPQQKSVFVESQHSRGSSNMTETEVKNIQQNTTNQKCLHFFFFSIISSVALFHSVVTLQVFLIIHHIVFDYLFVCASSLQISDSLFEYLWHFHFSLCATQLFRGKNYTYLKITFIYRLRFYI